MESTKKTKTQTNKITRAYRKGQNRPLPDALAQLYPNRSKTNRQNSSVPQHPHPATDSGPHDAFKISGEFHHTGRPQAVQSFILDTWNAAPIVGFVCISGYIIVLTVDRGSERLVRSLMGDLWNRGTRLREPTLEEVAKFHEKRYESGLLRPKPTPRCTKEAKNWREFLTGQPIAESDDSDSED